MTITSVSGPLAALVGVEVLVLDGDQRVHAGIEQLLSEASLHVTCTDSAQRALGLVDRQFFSVALVDIDTPAPRAGIETIAAIKKLSPTTMTGSSSRSKVKCSISCRVYRCSSMTFRGKPHTTSAAAMPAAEATDANRIQFTGGLLSCGSGSMGH